MTKNISLCPQAKLHAASVPVSGQLQLLKRISLRLDSKGSDERQKLEACIAQKFERDYSARIQQFLPYLLSLSTGDQLGAVLGLRAARQSSLFLEQYLPDRIEQSIARAFLTPVDRGQIVEIGNLASAIPGTACILFAVLASVLQQAGFRWVVCTATPRVHEMLGKLQFPSRSIGIADPACLGPEARKWGDYYASCPQIIAGDARVAAQQVASDPSLALLSRRFAKPIGEIAASLKASVK